MRAIDAEALKDMLPNRVKELEFQIKDGYFAPQYVRNMIDAMPTLDVTEVVRCKECKYLNAGENEVDTWYRCRILRREVDCEFFCGYGERDNE